MKFSATSLFFVFAFSLGTPAYAGTDEQPKPAATVAPKSVQAEAAVAETSAPATAQKKTSKPASGAARPKDLDLRHCLDLGDNIAIARCAYE